MNSPKKESTGQCRVVAGEKLPGDLAKAICVEINRAIEAASPTAHYDAEVRVLSSSRLAARLVVDGKSMPEQKFAVMDGQIELSSVRQFAASLAEVARSAKR